MAVAVPATPVAMPMPTRHCPCVAPRLSERAEIRGRIGRGAGRRCNRRQTSAVQLPRQCELSCGPYAQAGTAAAQRHQPGSRVSVSPPRAAQPTRPLRECRRPGRAAQPSKRAVVARLSGQPPRERCDGVSWAAGSHGDESARGALRGHLGCAATQPPPAAAPSLLSCCWTLAACLPPGVLRTCWRGGTRHTLDTLDTLRSRAGGFFSILLSDRLKYVLR